MRDAVLLLDVGAMAAAAGVADEEELLEGASEACDDATHVVDVGLQPKRSAVEQPQPGSVDL